MIAFKRLLCMGVWLTLAGLSVPANAAEKDKEQTSQEVKKDEVKKEESKPEEKKVAEKKEEKKEPKKEAKKDEGKVGLDTLSVQEPEGNWLFKRIWFEKGQILFEEIKVATDQAFDLRMAFFAKRTELDKTIFDPFYIETGFGRGELEEIITYLIATVEEQRKNLGALNEEERSLHEMLLKSKEQLNQLKEDIAAIGKIDNAVDEALSKLVEQLNLCRSYERDAWNNLKDISQELSDKRAKALYYAMMTHKDNILAISAYIKKDFNGYFEKLAKNAKEQIDRVKSQIKGLKEKGLDFKKQINKLEQKSRELEKKRESEREQGARDAAVKDAVEKTKEEMGWTVWLYEWWQGFTGMFSSAYQWITGLFGGSQEPSEVPAQEQKPAAPVEKETPATKSETQKEEPMPALQ